MEIRFFLNGAMLTTVDSKGAVRTSVLPKWVLAACPEPEFKSLPKADHSTFQRLTWDHSAIEEGGYQDYSIPPVPQADLERAMRAFESPSKRKPKAKNKKKRG